MTGASRLLLLLGCALLLGGCEHKPRAREREAEQARARAQARAKELSRRALLPLPEEPPVELLRTPDSGLPCKLEAVFAAKCRRCHTIPARHGAPLVFLTWEDTQQDRGGQKVAQVIGRVVQSGFMPYRIEANPPVVPLTDEEKKIILDWVDGGAPRESCDPNAPVAKKANEKVKRGSAARAPSAR